MITGEDMYAHDFIRPFDSCFALIGYPDDPGPLAKQEGVKRACVPMGQTREQYYYIIVS